MEDERLKQEHIANKRKYAYGPPVVIDGKLKAVGKYKYDDHSECCFQQAMDSKQLKYELNTVFPRKLALLRAHTYKSFAQECNQSKLNSDKVTHDLFIDDSV